MASVPDMEVRVTGLPKPVNLDQYLGLWAVEATRFLSLFERVSRMDLAAHVETATVNAGPARPERAEAGIALISIDGTMTKHGSSLSDAGSTIRLRQQVRAAESDDSIGGVIIKFDTPGGTVAGTADLGADIARLAKKKPVYAYVEDLCASAGYWCASQCTAIYANDPTAVVGSIGTFVGLYDMSGAAAKEGIRPVVIHSGGMKGAGFPGTEITVAQQEYFQGIVDKTQAQFTEAVARGRNLTAATVKGLADGRVHVAADAFSHGLIDGIKSFDDTLALLRGAMQSQQRKGKVMSEVLEVKVEELKPVAATYSDIVAACKGLNTAKAEDSMFICEQLQKNATVEDARSAWMETQQARIEAREQELTAAKSAATKQPVKGVPPLKTEGATAPEAAGDPIAQFESLVAEKVSAGMPKNQAFASVCRENKELREAFVQAKSARR